MRPVRLELEGFTAFRDRTVIDFDGADLFAMCGPTGAGKTSVIDAITFALYGSVPRLGDLRQVAPVISQGRVEARIRLDFTVAGDPYTAARVVRATKGGGATTKEARLEHGGAVLAGDADDVTKRVTELLGLDFRQFTTCVSLPQGDFARFLHDKPRDRQDLLVRLLDLGLYEKVAQLAGQRRTIAHDRATIAAGRLEQLGEATAASLDDVQQRVAALTALHVRVDAAQPELDALASEASAAAQRAEAAVSQVTLLDRVRVPDGVDGLAASVAEAVSARDAADVAEGAAESAVRDAEAALEGLPSIASLDAVVHQRAEAIELARQIERGDDATRAAEADDREAADALAAAEAALTEATAAVSAAKTAHAAHALAAELVVGEPCPVCDQVVTATPRSAPADVALAEKRQRAADKAVAGARKAAAVASAEHVRVDEKLVAIRERLATVERVLTDAPSDDAIARQREAVSAAEASVVEAKRVAADARRARQTAQAAADAAARAEAEARATFDHVRDGVAALGPPAPARADLASDWHELAAWVGERRPALVDEASAARETAERARDAHTLLARGLDDECAALGVRTTPSARDGVVDALARADAERERLISALADAERLTAEQAGAAADEAVAKALADHLHANRFEQWLLDEALQQLVERATAILRTLSLDAYSLTLDSKSRAFTVIDHVNADNVRSARTLSGGETFLASLALALALADEVAAMAGGAARLETILLDEGFGTLDPDTLDVVAAALEELGASGRMVGIVTHVRDLAERLPTRFEVSKIAGAATVERIDA